MIDHHGSASSGAPLEPDPFPLMSVPNMTAPAPEIYLCQVGERVSCGACCGLYNDADLTRPTLEAMLARRTAAFAGTPRTEDGLEGFRQRMEGWTPPQRPHPRFYHCPFLGLVGCPPGRVGCLLHPDAPGNGGVDYREFSYYGAKACRTYFCTASHRLNRAQAAVVQQCLNHWHPYGLVVTEHRFLTALFDEMARRGHRLPQPSDFDGHPQAAAAFRRLATLKLDWPHRRPGSPGPCHSVLDDPERPPFRGEFHRPRARPARYTRIFRELDTVFASRDAQKRAENQLDRLFNRLATVLS